MLKVLVSLVAMVAVSVGMVTVSPLAANAELICRDGAESQINLRMARAAEFIDKCEKQRKRAERSLKRKRSRLSKAAVRKAREVIQVAHQKCLAKGNRVASAAMATADQSGCKEISNGNALVCAWTFVADSEQPSILGAPNVTMTEAEAIRSGYMSYEKGACLL